ncbi:hypothetical protein [Gimesia maris]|uniref:hypothetical protein n=1 Tax=Gimesia maris TaxID=122 RepID=UPI003A9030CF
METLLCVSSDSFLLAALGPDVHPGLPFSIGVLLFSRSLLGEPTVPWSLILKIWEFFSWPVTFLFCMVDYFVEAQEGVKGHEQFKLAIQVDTGPTQGDAGAVSGRCCSMCGDPQAYIGNWCDYAN